MKRSAVSSGRMIAERDAVAADADLARDADGNRLTRLSTT